MNGRKEQEKNAGDERIDHPGGIREGVDAPEPPFGEKSGDHVKSAEDCDRQSQTEGGGQL